MWQRIQDRPGNAADTAAKGLSEAWKTATTHNPELDRVGNGLEVVRAGFAGFGSLKDAGMELLGAGDIADLTETGQSIAAVAALDALPVETLPQALDALDKGAAQWQNIKGAYEEAGKDWAAYKRENPNKAMAAEAAWGIAQDFFGKRVGGKRHADEGKRRTNDTNVSKSVMDQARADNGSRSPNAQAALKKKLSALQNAQKEADKVKVLPDGRIRYYAKERPAQTKGPTRGSSFVTEYDPNTGKVRQWGEDHNHDGKVTRVHPKNINGQDVTAQHYPPTKKSLK